MKEGLGKAIWILRSEMGFLAWPRPLTGCKVQDVRDE